MPKNRDINTLESPVAIVVKCSKKVFPKNIPL